MAAVFLMLWLTGKNRQRRQEQKIKFLEDGQHKAERVAAELRENARNLKKEHENKDIRLKKAERDLRISTEKREKILSGQARANSELQTSLAKQQGDIEHLNAQTEALIQQLQEADEEKRELRAKLASAGEELSQKAQQAQQVLKNKLRDMEKKSKNLDQELRKKDQEMAKIEEKLSHADPELIRKARLKLNQYSHLYKLMRSQKEMAYERIHNWELALQLLSPWVLEQQGRSIPKGDRSLGSIVAEALEAAKLGPLVKDEFSPTASIAKASEERPPPEDSMAPSKKKVEATAAEPFEGAIIIRKNGA